MKTNCFFTQIPSERLRLPSLCRCRYSLTLYFACVSVHVTTRFVQLGPVCVYVCMHVCIPLKRCATDVSASIQFHVVQVPACVMRIKCCKYVCGFTHIHNGECTLHTAHGIYRNIRNSIEMMSPIPVCIALFVMHFIRCTQVFHVLTAIHTVWYEVNILTRRRS